MTEQRYINNPVGLASDYFDGFRVEHLASETLMNSRIQEGEDDHGEHVESGIQSPGRLPLCKIACTGSGAQTRDGIHGSKWCEVAGREAKTEAQLRPQ